MARKQARPVKAPAKVAPPARAGRSVLEVGAAPPDPKKLYYVRNAGLGYGYGDIPRVEQGMLIQLQGERNDDKMVRIGYFMEYKPGVHGLIKACRVCGRKFAGPGVERALNAHGVKNHERVRSSAGRPESDEQEDARIEREERAMTQGENRLFLDKTAASAEG
jgi:hypothetical protein